MRFLSIPYRPAEEDIAHSRKSDADGDAIVSLPKTRKGRKEVKTVDQSHSISGAWEEERARLAAENQSLRGQLDAALETLRAIREGAVDALAIDTPEGQRVFTLQGAERTYRQLVERMRVGAATLTPEGVVHYCNHRFAEMLKLPLAQVIGRRVEDFVVPAAQAALEAMLGAGAGRRELALSAAGGEVPVLASVSALAADGPDAVCLVVTDLTQRKRYEAAIHRLNEELEQRVIERTAQLAAANRDLQAEIVERTRAEDQ
jgi:PAS domain S-box-containing protein